MCLFSFKSSHFSTAVHAFCLITFLAGLSIFGLVLLDLLEVVAEGDSENSKISSVTAVLPAQYAYGFRFFSSDKVVLICVLPASSFPCVAIFAFIIQALQCSGLRSWQRDNLHLQITGSNPELIWLLFDCFSPSACPCSQLLWKWRRLMTDSFCRSQSACRMCVLKIKLHNLRWPLFSGLHSLVSLLKSGSWRSPWDCISFRIQSLWCFASLLTPLYILCGQYNHVSSQLTGEIILPTVVCLS